jgi:hypothetical protein
MAHTNKKAPAPTKTQDAFETNTNDCNSTNQATSAGYFPVRHDTVTAEVLSRLLRGEHLTGMGAVFCANTTRLAAVIDYLGDSYLWNIERINIEVGTKDGRIAVIRTYFLTRATIRHAFDSGALEFIRSVASARAKLRTKASKVIAEAKRRNGARLSSRIDPRQMTLLGGGYD